MIRQDAALPQPLLVLMAVGVAAVVGALAVLSVQAALTAVLVVTLVAAYLHSPRLGLLLLWALWLLVPGVRRLLALLGPVPGNDPLSVLPFVATGALGVLEAQRCRLDGRARYLVAMAVAGLAFGVPLGLRSPQALVFAGLAYFAAVSAFFIGWAEVERSRGSFSLRTALLAGAPVIAAYGVYQYFDTPLWDEMWIASVDFESLGAPEEGKIRIFSSLNSPGALAGVMSLAMIFALGSRRLGVGHALAIVPITAALALTYVRGTWIALLVALLAFAALGRARSAPRVASLLVFFTVLVLAAGYAGPTGAAFKERVSTAGELGDDISATERLFRFQEIPSAARSAPAGRGLGQAGEASELTDRPGGPSDIQKYPDNGILALIFQSGPAGALLVMGALLWGLSIAVRRALGRSAEAIDLVIATAIAFLVVAMLFGDTLFGITGAILWYLLGIALARAQAEEPAEPPQRTARRAPAARVRSSPTPRRVPVEAGASFARRA